MTRRLHIARASPPTTRPRTTAAVLTLHGILTHASRSNMTQQQARPETAPAVRFGLWPLRPAGGALLGLAFRTPLSDSLAVNDHNLLEFEDHVVIGDDAHLYVGSRSESSSAASCM